jgi:hypothetical protein
VIQLIMVVLIIAVPGLVLHDAAGAKVDPASIQIIIPPNDIPDTPPPVMFQ